MCGRYYLGESEETSFWIEKTMQSSLVKEWQKKEASAEPTHTEPDKKEVAA